MLDNFPPKVLAMLVKLPRFETIGWMPARKVVNVEFTKDGVRATATPVERFSLQRKMHLQKRTERRFTAQHCDGRGRRSMRIRTWRRHASCTRVGSRAAVWPSRLRAACRALRDRRALRRRDRTPPSRRRSVGT